jgi:hypothetical protein
MLRIVNGRVYDPLNGIDGEVRDVCIQDGKIVAHVPPEARRIDAHGMVIMPGGVDIHCHIAGPPAPPHAVYALGIGRHRPFDLCYGLPLRHAGLHHGDGGGGACARGAPHHRRVARHARDRQRLLHPDGQQPAVV